MAGFAGVRVLVTGGNGFVGSHLVRRLVTEGAHVVLIVRERSQLWRIDDLLPQIERHHADMTDAPALGDAVQRAKPQLVFHLAGRASGRGSGADAQAWPRSLRTNLRGTFHLIQALHQQAPSARRLIRVGTMEEYGDGPSPFREDQRERAVSPYSASVVAATQLAHALGPQWNLPVVTLRPSVVYGPAQATDFFIPGLIAACLDGRDFPMTTGVQAVDYVFVADLIDALLAAATATGVEGEIVNVGSGQEVKIRDVAQRIVDLSATKTQLQLGAIPHRAAESQRRVMDVTKAKALLNWEPSTTLDEGLTKTLEWFRGEAHR